MLIKLYIETKSVFGTLVCYGCGLHTSSRYSTTAQICWRISCETEETTAEIIIIHVKWSKVWVFSLYAMFFTWLQKKNSTGVKKTTLNCPISTWF